MHSSFQYKDGEFYIGDVSLTSIAESVGTPYYVYSYDFLKDSYTAYAEAFSDMDTLICYSVKANSNLAILKRIAALDFGTLPSTLAITRVSLLLPANKTGEC